MRRIFLKNHDFFRRVVVVCGFIYALLWGTFGYAECERSLERTLTELGRTLPTKTMTVGNATELADALTQANSNGGHVTILLRDGTYNLSKMLYVKTDHIAFRSISGDRDAVILRGNGMTGNVPHVFLVSGSYFTVADLTLGWIANHGIQVQGENNADAPLVHNVRFVNTGEQMLKVSKKEGGAFSDDGVVEWSLFEYTAGIGPQYYIGGVDAHRVNRWVIRNNVFKHIRSPETLLAEHAIHIWADSLDTLVEKNIIVDSDRGIGFGLEPSGHIRGIIRNNMIHTSRDVGIDLQHADGTQVYNNTVYTEKYTNSIEYRYSDSRNIKIYNNLTNGLIRQRNSASATLSNNVTDAQKSWFVNAASGDMHLTSAIATVVNQGKTINSVVSDIDCEARPQGSAYDIGADEMFSGTPAVTYYTLNVNVSGDGDGSVSSVPSGISCGSDCSESYEENTMVSLSAVAEAGSQFDGWSGACQGQATCEVTMDAAKSVTATFSLLSPEMYTLNVTTTGSGSVTSIPSGISCGSDCSESYEENTSVKLSAVAEAGSQFDGWSGACQGQTTCEVTMDAAKFVSAAFTLVPVNTSSYFGFDDFGGTWHDAAQTPAGDLAWAAAAANILEWTGWDTSAYSDAQAIYENLETHWTNEPGLMEYGWNWWLNGYTPTPEESPSQVDDSAGNYWANYDFFNYFHEDWADVSDGLWSNGGHVLESIDSYLHSGYGVTLAAYDSNEASQGLSVWGYEYDDLGNYLGLWVTDSLDQTEDMVLLSLELVNGDMWYLDPDNQYGYEGWVVGGIQALEQRPEMEPVPEPGTLILLGLGLFGLFNLTRKTSRK